MTTRLEALGSPHHRVREKATSLLIERKAVAKLAEHAGTAKESLGAANALWALVRIDSAESKKSLEKGTQHRDPAVRRLAIELLRRYQVPSTAEVAKRLAKDEDPAVLVAAAQGRGDAAEIRAALRDALTRGAAADPHLRYEAAWHLAKHADRDAFTSLLNADDKNVHLAGLIALDVACFEAFASKEAALAILAQQLENPRRTMSSICSRWRG